MWFLFLFVHQITVPGTLPTTAGGGGWIHPAPPCPSMPSASPPTSSWAPDVSGHGSCGAPVTWKREEKERCRVHYSSESPKKTFTLHPGRSGGNLQHASNQPSYRGLKDDSTPLCYKNRRICGMWRMTPQTSLLHRSAGCSRCGVSSEHAEPAIWSVLF